MRYAARCDDCGHEWGGSAHLARQPKKATPTPAGMKRLPGRGPFASGACPRCGSNDKVPVAVDGIVAAPPQLCGRTWFAIVAMGVRPPRSAWGDRGAALSARQRWASKDGLGLREAVSLVFGYETRALAREASITHRIGEGGRVA